MKIRIVAACLAATSVFLPAAADACTRAVYFGMDGQTITGRTMEWVVPDVDTNLRLYPRELERTSNTKTPLSWKSKYGSVAISIYEAASIDGMNEKGLVANLLYLTEAEYPAKTEGDNRPTVSIAGWLQYVLDNYATVAEAVDALGKQEFRVVPVTSPTGQAGTVHLSVSDPSGDSAIFEFIGGKLKIHHGREYQVMTNEPPFDQQLALAAYWKDIGGSVVLPGTNRASDRFARASYYINTSTQTADPRLAVATVLSVMRNVSTPIGIATPGRPNAADTLWVTVADQKNKVYYFQDTRGPGTVWVRFSGLDFSAGSGPRLLQLDGNPDLAGDQTQNFKPTELFKFLAPEND